jgi:hypothetical protein
MQPEGSLSRSQDPAPYPESDESSPYQPILFIEVIF